MKIIQLTDTHLFCNDELRIFDVQSNKTFSQVIDNIIAQDIDQTDLILLTGDVSQDETVESYQIVVDRLSKLKTPIYWIPGNHDNIERIDAVFKTNKNFYRKRDLDLPGWYFIFLNTKLDGTDKGYLTNSELLALRQKIAAAPEDKHIAIIMHHHPAHVCTPLIDNYILINRQEFWEVITNTKVKLVMCGHVHGNYSFEMNGIMIEASPSTCLQWQKGTQEICVEKMIGYKVFYFDESSYYTEVKIW